MWHNKYIGIPYKDKGRDYSGLDCWGLVRLVYSEQFNIILPSFTEQYTTAEDLDLINETISYYKDGWEQVQEPEIGTIILFRVMGTLSHVGIYIGDQKFIHARHGVGSVIVEKLDSVQWANRIFGFYKYKESTDTILNSVPHPLQVTKYEDKLVPGSKVQDLIDILNLKYKIPTEIKADYIVFINGKPIPHAEWNSREILEGDKVEYRAIAKGGGGIRNLIFIAIAIVAVMYAPEFAEAIFSSTELGAEGVMVTTSATKAQVAMTQFAITAAGMALVNAIAPIRMPGTNDPGEAVQYNLFQGGSNPSAKYAPIPVVLGTNRITPPLGAQQYLEYNEDGKKTYLRSLVVWGYGPLDVTDIQIGTRGIDTYADTCNYKTDNGFNFDPQSPVYDVYGSDVWQTSPRVQLVNNSTYNVGGVPPWTDIVVTQADTNKIKLSLHFPEGLRKIQTTGANAGTVFSAPFTAEYEYIKLNSNLEIPAGGTWATSTLTTAQTSFVIPTARLTTTTVSYDEGSNSTTTTTDYWRNVKIFISPQGILQYRIGAPTLTQAGQPTQEILEKFYNTRYSNLTNTNETLTKIPSIPVNSIVLYDFYIYGGNGIQGGTPSIQTAGLSSYTGFTLTTVTQYTALFLQVGAGTYTRSTLTAGTISIGDEGQPFNKYKDAFTYNVEIPNLVPGYYKVRIRRTNSDIQELPEGSTNPEARNYHKAYLYSVTAYNNSKPIELPSDITVAKTGISILASDSVNGTLEGINGLVSSYCFDYNESTGQWDIFKPTSNPASLFLYIFYHSANIYRVTFSSLPNYVDITAITNWWIYCKQKGFEYNNVIANTTSILDLLKDIAAAGRASPTLINGKWSVIIDQPRTTVVQHFTPYNSWGFEATKPLIKKPHAFKVTIRDQNNAYQDETIIIPNKGYTESSAQIIEEINLPGVTNKELAYLHARWHLAQLDYRPETYTLNTDFEYLVCSRGDLVRVMHDVPLWGVASTRINNVNSTTQLVLDDSVYLESNKTYTIRVRTQAGTFVSKQLVAVTQGDYTTISVTSAFATTGSNVINRGDLVIIEETQTQTAQLIVLSVEPQDNLTARLVLTDYSPEMYEIDNTSGYPISNFDPKITLPPKKLIDTVNVTPIISSDGILSDERAIVKTSQGSFINNIVVSFTNPIDLPTKVASIECNYDYTSVPSTQYQFTTTTTIDKNSIVLENVQESVAYKLRLRYVTSEGLVGPWSTTINHTVVGKTNPPSNITNFTYTTQKNTGKIVFKWDPVTDIDLDYYEIRTTDTSTIWSGNTNTGLVFKGNTTTCEIQANSLNTTTYYIRARDIAGNTSRISQSVSITIDAPPIPVVISTQDSLYNSISTSEAKANIEWVDGTFGTNGYDILEYEIWFQYLKSWEPNNPIVGEKFIITKNKYYSLLVLWKDVNPYAPGFNAGFLIRSIDVAGNISDWSSVYAISYNKPAQIDSSTIEITTDKNTKIVFSWPESEKTNTRLPIAGYEVRNQDSGWGDTNYIFKGQKTFVEVTPIGTQPYSGLGLTQTQIYSGTYRWYLRSFNTVGDYSDTTVLEYTVTPPSSINIQTLKYTFQDTNLTNATVTINWDNIVTSAFGIAQYIITAKYINKQQENITLSFTTKSNSIVIPVDWVDRQAEITVYAEDNLSVQGRSNLNLQLVNDVYAITGTSILVPLYKPKAVDNLKAEVIDNNVLFYWDIPSLKTNPLDANEQISRLPVAYTKFKKGSDWATAEDLGNKSGSFTTLYERIGGTYTYWAAAVDTEGNEGIPTSTTVKVNQPPDYVFYNELTSNLTTGTLVNAVRDPNTNQILIPVDTSETWTTHFSSRSWSTPDDQIAAGYPYFMQPGTSSGTYTETFDFGTVISSTQASLTIGRSNISGAPSLSYEIQSSTDNVTFTTVGSNTDSVNLQNFRYLKVIIVVTQNTVGDLLQLSSISVRLDSKMISDTGTVTSDTTATGTIVNFDKAFLDVSSIVVSPNTTNAYVTTYDHRDYVESTVCYISSNQCYVLTPKAHGLETGQKINLYFARPPRFKPLFSQLGEVEYDNGKYTQKGSTLPATSNKLISNSELTLSYPNSIGAGFTCNMSTNPGTDYGAGIWINTYSFANNTIPEFGWKFPAGSTSVAYCLYQNSIVYGYNGSTYGKRFHVWMDTFTSTTRWAVNGSQIFQINNAPLTNYPIRFHSYLPQNVSILYPTFSFGSSDTYLVNYTTPSATTATITKIDNYNFSFALTATNTDLASLKYYPNSIRVFVYNQSGTRIGSVPVSWTVRGF